MPDPDDAPPKKPTRDLGIERLRGLAIALMVVGHVIGYQPTQGIGADDGTVFRWLYNTAGYIVPMTLFAAISGYVYALRPVTRATLGKFFDSKLKRIVVPFVVVTALTALAKMIVPGQSLPPHIQPGWWWRPWVIGFDQFWFLQALLFCFAVLLPLELLGIMKTLAGWVVCFVATLLIATVPPNVAYVAGVDESAVWQLPSAMWILPFFLLGLGLYRFASTLERPTVGAAFAIAAVASIALQQANLIPVLLGNEPMTSAVAIGRIGWIGLALGVSVTAALIVYRRFLPVPGLLTLGSYSYGIYLLHMFAIGGVRVVLNKLGVTADAPHFAAGLLAGLLVPIAIELLILRRSKTAMALVLGQWPRKRKPAV